MCAFVCVHTGTHIETSMRTSYDLHSVNESDKCDVNQQLLCESVQFV